MRTPLQLTLAARKANSTTGGVNRSMVQGKDCSPLFSTCETPSRRWIQLWAPLVLERHPSSGMVSVRSTCPVRSSWGTGTCSAWRRNSFGENTAEQPACIPMWGELREDGAGVSLWCTEGARQNSHNLTQRKFRLQIKKTFPPPWGQASSRAGCPKGLHRLHPFDVLRALLISPSICVWFES